jgi:hypothetical protein
MKPAYAMKAGYRKQPQYRDDHGMRRNAYSAPKAKRGGAQCDRDDDY